VIPYSNFHLALFHYDLAALQIDRGHDGKLWIVIVHRYGDSSIRSACIPGEEIISSWLVWNGRSYWLPLSGPHLILFDYIARHSGVPQNARQIAEGLNAEANIFYAHHASNSPGRSVVRPRTTRPAVRKQVERIRERLRISFEENLLPFDPELILRSELTSSNEVRYWIDADIHVEHSGSL
jgi:hypothetical protein